MVVNLGCAENQRFLRKCVDICAPSTSQNEVTQTHRPKSFIQFQGAERTLLKSLAVQLGGRLSKEIKSSCTIG